MKFRIFTQKLLAVSVLGLFLANAAFSQENYSKRADQLLVSKKRTGIQGKNSSKRFIEYSGLNSNSNKIKPGSNRNKAAGDTLYYENFQFTTWPSTLTRLNLDGKPPGNNTGSTINTQLFGSNAWVTTTLAPNPNRWAASISWTTAGGAVDRWLVTPPITLTTANKLSWLARASNVDFPDGYEVRICTSCPATITNANVTSSFSTTLFSIAEEEVPSNAAFVSREVSLDGYDNQVVRIAFRNTSVDMDRLYIDNLLVYRTPEIEVAATKIISPDTNIYNCSKSNFPSVVSVTNSGAKTAYNVAVKLKSTGPINDSVSIVLDSLEKSVTDTIVFAEGLDLSAVGEYQLDLTVSVVGDANPDNNSLNTSFGHAAPASGVFSFDFEDQVPADPLPAGWFATSRFRPLIEGSGFNGSNALEIPVYNNLGAFGSDPDASIITNQFTNIPVGSTLSVKYHIYNLAGPEYQLVNGDTVSVLIYKNCVLSTHSIKIHADNQSVSSDYQKLFIPTDSLGLIATDNVSIEFRAQASASTGNFLLDIDEVVLGTTNDNDISITGISQPENTIIKRYQIASFPIKGNVFNEGSTTVSPVNILATALPSTAEGTATISSLPGGFSKPFTTTPGFTFSESGDYNIEVTATGGGATDPNPANNTSTFALILSDSTMAKDIGEPINTNGLGYGPTVGGKRIMANAITTSLKDTLTSVSLFTGALDTDIKAKAFFANRNTAGTGWVEDSSATSVDIPLDQANSWVTLRYRLRTGAANLKERGKAILANTTNIYGVKIGAGNLRISFNFDNATDDGSWIWLGGQWLGTQDLTIGAVTFFIRPNFGRLSTINPVAVSQIEQSLQFAELVPNPTVGPAQLSILLNKNKEVTIGVYSLDGRKITSQTSQAFTGSNRIDLPVKGLQKGIYLVKLNADGFSATKKLIVE